MSSSVGGGQILPGLPVIVVYTAELMNRRTCPILLVVCEVQYGKVESTSLLVVLTSNYSNAPLYEQDRGCQSCSLCENS